MKKWILLERYISIDDVSSDVVLPHSEKIQLNIVYPWPRIPQNMSNILVYPHMWIINGRLFISSSIKLIKFICLSEEISFWWLNMVSIWDKAEMLIFDYKEGHTHRNSLRRKYNTVFVSKLIWHYRYILIVNSNTEI